jgi:divalent metal cation (Fe/Co/Zn/Cd) transporter
MLTVSLFLVVGSIGIGLHSYHLLTAIHFPPSNILSHLPHLPDLLSSIGESHSHSHSVATVVPDHAHGEAEGMGVLDPNAAWTALLSVVVKEWLYRVTKKVGEEEGSSVLAANVRLLPHLLTLVLLC